MLSTNQTYIGHHPFFLYNDLLKKKWRVAKLRPGVLIRLSEAVRFLKQCQIPTHNSNAVACFALTDEQCNTLTLERLLNTARSIFNSVNAGSEPVISQDHLEELAKFLKNLGDCVNSETKEWLVSVKTAGA